MKERSLFTIVLFAISLLALGQKTPSHPPKEGIKQKPGDGPFELRFKSGEVKQSGSFKNGLRDSLWKTYSAPGVLSSEATYVNDTLEGPFAGYDKTGALTLKTEYTRGRKSGRQQQFLKDGLLIESIYAADTLLEQSQFRDKLLIKKTPYQNNKKNGEEQEFVNGLLMSSTMFVNDTLDGERTVYDAKGFVKRKTYYKGGLKNGKEHEFGDGAVVQTTMFVDNRMEGEKIQYDKAGNKTKLETYVADKLHGPFKTWSGGRLTKEGSYLSGIKSGAWKDYDHRGKIKLEEKWESGVKLP